jgi:hypothetical protein
MKKAKQLTEITLWKDNKITGEFKMTIEEFKEKFFQWLKTKEKSWCEYYGSRVAVSEFIGKELNSVAECDMKAGVDIYSDLAEVVKDEFWKLVETELA